MSLKYHSGQVIMKGDRVLFHGEPGTIEFVIDGLVGDPAMDWHMKENGPGVMIIEPKAFGRVYTRETQDDEQLVFLGRTEGP